MPDQNQLVDELRRRIAYPTVYLPRELDHAGNPAETEERWAARAVTAGLDDGTLGYVPAGQQLHRADFDHLAAERDRWKNHSTQVQFETDRLTVQLAAIRDLAKRWTSRPNTPEHDCGVDILKTLGRFDGGTASVPGSSRRAQEGWPSAEEAARLWHNTYEKLAPEYGYLTRPESRVPWREVPERNRALMVAVCGKMLDWLGGRVPEPAWDPSSPQTAVSRSFEDLLAAPYEQFDRRGELLKSIVEYANAPSSAASTGESQASEPARRAMLRGLTAAPMLAQVAERARVEAEAGAPARMVAHYVAVEARHLASSHDGPAQDCQDCNRAVHADQSAAPKLAQGGRRDGCGPDCSECHTYEAGCAIRPPARAFIGEKPCGRPGCPCGS